jgi:tetratricopeptide (TPR) repeat protein
VLAVLVSSARLPLGAEDLQAPPSAAAGAQRVEFRCKLTAPRPSRASKFWRVELKRSSGEPVRTQIVAGDGTVRYRELAPAIYVLCVSGEKGQGRCESVDLTPPPNVSLHIFRKEVAAPVTAPNGDAHRVDARLLAVPERARREMIRAEEAQLRGESRQAVGHLERALEIHPSYADALNNLGTHYHRIGDYARAIDYFTRVTEIDPRSFPGWINLGGSLLALGKLNPALAANAKALTLRPNDPLGNSQLALNYFYLRRYREAKPLFERVLVLDPLSANAPQLFLAQIAMAGQSPAEAAGHIRGYLELHPNSPRRDTLRRTLENLTSRTVSSNREALPVSQ